jgi:uncharacterized protein (TIGR03000 family)
MYTLVLAALLTTGNQAPDWGCRGGCHGCWGGCRGCWGGCYGCWGGCYGCWGGCYGCGGGCFGCYGCGGCGGMVVAPATVAPVAAPVGRTAAAPAVQPVQDLRATIEELRKEQTQLRKTLEQLRRSREESALPDPQRGTIVLVMPEDALVVINDERIDADSVFRTPPLEPGKELVVNVEAAVVSDGKSINRAKRLTIHRGEIVRLAFKDMESVEGRWTKSGDSVPSPARITVRLPADARLTVDGVDCPLISDTRTFDTPALAPGQKYYYLLKAEVMRQGRPIAQTRRVDFRSGERVTVTFENLGANLVTAR